MLLFIYKYKALVHISKAESKCLLTKKKNRQSDFSNPCRFFYRGNFEKFFN